MNGTNHPWTDLYPPHVDHTLEADCLPAQTLTQAWTQRVAADPQQPALRYFDQTLDAARTDELSDALAVYLSSRGVSQGDKVGVQLQNVPQFALCMLALWKIGASALILNTMYGSHELRTIFTDAHPHGLISSETSSAEVATLGLGEAAPWVLNTDDADASLLGDVNRPPELDDSAQDAPSEDPSLVAEFLPFVGRHPEAINIQADDPALLTYTSGTTGPPKGAVGTHRNLLTVSHGVQQWLNVHPGDGVLAVAPIFHITGAVATATMALTQGRAMLVFVGRIRPDSMLTALRTGTVHHILGSITVYNALLNSPLARQEDFAGLKSVYSGGAPVPPATVVKFEERFGHYVNNIYGMTETASATIGVPLGLRAPQDPGTGTLAIGVPLPGMDARIVSPDGHDVPIGEPGELVLKGPQCITEYLNRPDATADTIQDGWLHTGDVAVTDDAGWIYVVDRQKDQINVSGYKVWPREVEDVLYEFPGVKEAAVVGLPDKYSGERVVAFVSLQAGQQADPDDIRNYVKSKIATFKAPREVTVLADLPKTPTGKIQRRVLRSDDTAAAGDRTSGA